MDFKSKLNTLLAFGDRSTKTGEFSPAGKAPFPISASPLTLSVFAGDKRAPGRENSSDAAHMFDRASPAVNRAKLLIKTKIGGLTRIITSNCQRKYSRFTAWLERDIYVIEWV